MFITLARERPCLPLWGRWHGKCRAGEGFSLPSQSKIKDFCQLSQRESQGYGAKLKDKLKFEVSLRIKPRPDGRGFC